MAEKLTIQFSAKGGGELKKTINDLHLANVQLTKGQAAFVKAQKQVTQATQKASQIISVEKKSMIMRPC